MIILSKKVYEFIAVHATSMYPLEACGILAGTGCRTTEYFPIKNLDNSSISFFMDPKEQLEVMKKIRAQDLKMFGIFHSHIKAGSAPSKKDVRLAVYTDVSYLIMSLGDIHKPVLRSYKIQNCKVSKEKITVE